MIEGMITTGISQPHTIQQRCIYEDKINKLNEKELSDVRTRIHWAMKSQQLNTMGPVTALRRNVKMMSSGPCTTD